jgi:branched-subunit amino acid aminotransferase/4-amino-4-deoxychorismate lyase
MSEIIILQSGDAAALNPTQSGFAHGFGIFETIKLSQGRLCFWQAHWQRFYDSAVDLGLPLDHTPEGALVAIRELVQAEGLRDGTVKLSLLKAGAGASCYVYTRPAMAATATLRLQLTTANPINEHSRLAGHKTHNYMENMLLLESARAQGYSDVLRVNTAGVLAETTVANLFFIKQERLCTPAASTGILPGVIRAEVLRLAESLAIPVEEGSYSPAVLRGAEAVFLTNSSVGIRSMDTISGGGLDLMLPSEPRPLLDALTSGFLDVEMKNSVLLLDD